MGVLCQVLAMSKHPVAPVQLAAAMASGGWSCWGSPAGWLAEGGGGLPFLSAPSYFAHHHGAPGEIPLHAGEPTFLPPRFSSGSCGAPALLPSCQDAGDEMGSCRAWLALPPIQVTGTPEVSQVTWRGCGRGWWHPEGVGHSALLRGEVSPPCEQGLQQGQGLTPGSSLAADPGSPWASAGAALRGLVSISLLKCLWVPGAWLQGMLKKRPLSQQGIAKLLAFQPGLSPVIGSGGA